MFKKMDGKLCENNFLNKYTSKNNTKCKKYILSYILKIQALHHL